MSGYVDILDLRLLLNYDPDSGILTWRSRPVEMFQHCAQPIRSSAWWNRTYSMKEAGFDHGGYRRVKILKKSFMAHRVCWSIYYGEWPADQIDHINGRRDDNRIANLRDVTGAENSKNAKTRSDNKSGRVGVSWYEPYQKWVAHIGCSGKFIYLGYFDDFSEACAVRARAEIDRGFHTNHGRPAA